MRPQCRPGSSKFRSIVIFLIGNTLSGFATSFITMMLARMLTATVAGAIISLIMTFASAIAPRNKRASLVSWIDPEIYVRAAEMLRMPPETCMGFEDSQPGLTALNGSGAVSVGIGTPAEIKTAKVQLPSTKALTLTNIEHALQ